MMAKALALAMMDQKRPAILLTGLLAIVIACLTLFPLEVPQGVPGTDKTHHVIAFAALVLPAAFLFPRILVWTAPFAILFGGAIELVQPYVGRFRSLGDFQADMLGVLVGVLIGLLLRRCILVISGQSKRA